MNDEKKLYGLGGWLILVGLGVVISPLRLGAEFLSLYQPIFTDGTWEALTHTSSEAYQAIWAPLILGEVAFNVLMLLASVWLIYLFFRKHYLFPKVYIAIASISLIFIPLDAWLVSFAMPDDPIFDPDTTKGFSKALVQALIWIPYMMRSRRVKATFVENLPGSDAMSASDSLGHAAPSQRKVGKILGAVLVVLVISRLPAILERQTNVANVGVNPPVTEPNSIGAADDAVVNWLVKTADGINKGLPMMVDSETRLDSSVGYDKELQYLYTLVNYTADEIDPKVLRENLESNLINSVCTSDEMKIFLDNGISVSYRYRGNQGKMITKISVSPSMCENVSVSKVAPVDESKSNMGMVNQAAQVLLLKD